MKDGLMPNIQKGNTTLLEERIDSQVLKKTQDKLILVELADPQCSLCKHIIQEVNEIFEQDDTICPDPRECCIIHLLEAVHTTLVWRLSRQ